jgi:hypothetical protein
MTDDELVEAFESCNVPRGGFRHIEHVRLTHLYLQRFSTLEALGKLSTGLAALAGSRGRLERYHETVTWAHFFLIQERMRRSRRQLSWDEFAERHADILDWKNTILRQYYYKATLNSPVARRMFVMPDRLVQ